MADITMPQLGETVTEGTITRWAKQVGDKVEVDEVLFEVSTDKVDSEVPSSAAGYLTEVLVPEGETVDVGTRLAVISEGSGDAPSPVTTSEEPPPPPPPPSAAAAPPPAPAAEATPAPAEPATPAPPPPEAERATPAPPPPPAAEPAPAAQTAKPTKGQATSDQAGAAESGNGDARLLSPVVRRLLAEHNLDPSTITGTGAGGRITRDDVLAVIDTNAAGSAPASTTPAPAPTPSAAPAPAPTTPSETGAPREREEIIPFSKIRKITAEHMVRSRATSAHTLVVVEVDYEGVERVRRAQRDAFKETEGMSLTYLPFVSRATIDAIGEFPHVNASVGDNQLIVHRYVNLGIAVDLNFEGLLVPVIHDAEGKRLRAIAREIHDLATRARSKRLGADDIAGGTFTITNAGPFGTLMTAAVINQPQVAILSTDGVKKKPVAIELPDGTDAVAVHPVGLLALTFDHRAFDGAYAAAFVARVREILETRDWAQEF
ncbi:MAG: dihydrolipoamide acetyltransferase family protein [Acidimicrobiales bacterium]